MSGWRYAAACLLVAMTAQAASPAPGCVERVIQNGVVVVDRAQGVRRVGAAAPLSADTAFRLASLSKQFTAAAILHLVAAGRLSLEDRIGDLLPELPAYTRAITVRQLLTHTGGLPDYEDLMEQPGGTHYTATRQISDEGVLRLLSKTQQPRFAPGSKWAYSNSGYVVLGLVVARVSARPLAEALDDAVFARLGMTATHLHVPGRDSVQRRAYGHSVAPDGRFVVDDQSPTSATGGDGGIYSTAADLSIWLAALTAGTVLPPSLIPEAFTPTRLSDGSPTVWPTEPDEDNLDPGGPVAYGYGWFLDPYEGHARRWHFGTTQGFRTAIDWFPAERVGSIVLCNRMDIDARERALANARAYLTR
jgi:CubicO group peptidase (beta-lactamase class C family)